MYRTVIWATDGSDGAEAALREAIRLAESSDGRVVAVHCDRRLTGSTTEWPVLADEDQRKLRIRRQVRDLRELGFDIDLVERTSRREAADVVAKVASELHASVIVCGTRGFGSLAGALRGSFAHRLLHVAPCPVLVVRRQVDAASTAGRDLATIEGGVR